MVEVSNPEDVFVFCCFFNSACSALKLEERTRNPDIIKIMAAIFSEFIKSNSEGMISSPKYSTLYNIEYIDSVAQNTF